MRSPELLLGAAYDERVDVWGVGAVYPRRFEEFLSRQWSFSSTGISGIVCGVLSNSIFLLAFFIFQIVSAVFFVLEYFYSAKSASMFWASALCVRLWQSAAIVARKCASDP